MTTSTYTVTGMNCGHCVSAVSEELGRLPAVRDVEVDLASGVVTVTSEGPVSEPEVREAIEEAGYELAGVTGS